MNKKYSLLLVLIMLALFSCNQENDFLNQEGVDLNHQTELVISFKPSVLTRAAIDYKITNINAQFVNSATGETINADSSDETLNLQISSGIYDILINAKVEFSNGKKSSIVDARSSFKIDKEKMLLNVSKRALPSNLHNQ